MNNQLFSVRVSQLVSLAFLLCLLSPLSSWGQPPEGDTLDPLIELVQPGVTLSLVTEHPAIVTPTGIDVDDDGQIWAVASHTHFRPKDYRGPAHDEVIVIDRGTPGHTASRRVFYNETASTMDLELGPDGWVYLAERDRILRVRDSDGDGRADQQENLAVLTTEADYPHNGLSGLAWHPNGDLVFALGENYWRDWTLTSTDNRIINGTGEGGVFSCRPDGSQLRRIARGFWNPFGLCVREDGTMFAAENDPGAMPPCRLLQIVEGGDYGYQRLYGSAPYHPFVCWNGELRGTLPMLHAVGEAPCGIAPLANGLVVPSWAEHRIDFYPLSAKGASFKTERVTLVRGGPNFRPTCITQASPTVFYLTDWVYGSYELHGRGRVWKLEVEPNATWLGDLKLDPPNEDAIQAADLVAGGDSYSETQLLSLARSSDSFIRHAAISAISKRSNAFIEKNVDTLDTEDRITLLLAVRRSQPKSIAWVRYFWKQPVDEIRFETLRWIADERLGAFQSDVDALLNQPEITYRIFEAALATHNVLSGNAIDGIADKKMTINRVTDPETSPKIRAFSLRLLDVNEKVFGSALWKDLYNTGDPALIAELTRALASAGSPSAISFLRQIANNEQLDPSIRSDAIAGIAATSESNTTWLIDLAESNEATLREEALRSLRFAQLDSDAVEKLRGVAVRFPESADLVEAAIEPSALKSGRPDVTDTGAWQSLLGAIAQPVDLAAGRRIFHHATVGACSKCHRHDGRGNVVGPDLSAVSNDGNPDRLLQALLEPSRDIDPQYFPRMLITEDGHVFTGLLLRDGGGGREVYRDNAGREQSFRTSDIAERKELHTSMMPDGLIDAMTDREIRDLIAFLDATGQREE
ncbi:MAG: c-type cytochrome [Phycisphaera sp. RhM]|nr:c-type cytochrome [Phycisphaera sp. RhM]